MTNSFTFQPAGWIRLGFLLVVLVGALPTLLRSDTEDMSPTDHARSLSKAFRNAARVVKPAVVTVTSSYRLTPEQLQQLEQGRRAFPDLGPFPQEEGEPDAVGRPTSVGSGVVVDPKGIVLTNNHVVQGAHEVRVRLSDGSEYKAVDIRTDPYSDLAVLRIDSDGELPSARWGDSSQLEIGDWVIAIGSPFDLEATVSAGIISAKGRMSMIKGSRLLQTDAAINPGNSGGALVDLNGEVIGINTAIATNTGSFQGVGFAIPANHAKWISKELLEHGRVRRAWLGVSIGELTADAARAAKLPARSGVWVLGVMPGSPAAKAGLKLDDVITEFGGTRIRAPGELQDVVEQRPVDSVQTLKVMRSGEPVSLDVSLEAMPASPDRFSGGEEEPSPGQPKRKGRRKE
jgi:serine protease Do